MIIAGCGLAGFSLSYIILKKKREPEPLVCPLKFHCDTVVHSSYSKLFGIPLEYLGMFYYGFISLSYISFLYLPEIAIYNFFVLATILATGFAFFFSMYLTSVQAFVLREWCTWCLMSAGLCIVIFLLVVQSSVFDTIPYLQAYRPFILGAHLIGLLLGFGGAIISDVFFMKFLKDLKISKNESETLKTLSQIVWFGLGIIVISGILLFLSDAERLSGSAKFLAKMIVVSVLIINGFLLNIIVAPKLTSMFFGKLTDKEKGVRNLRRLAFALGAVSMTSWSSAFILGIMRTSPASLHVILAIYASLLLIAITFSQIFELFASLREPTNREKRKSIDG